MNRLDKKLCWRWTIYIVGLLILALGIVLNTKTLLGVSPIISVPFVISQVWGLNLANLTFICYVIFVIAQFVIKGKHAQKRDLLQIAVSLLVTRVMDVYSSLITVVPETLVQKLLLLALAVVLTGIGLTMSVLMDLVPNPGDGIVQAISWRSGKSMGFAKNCFDIGMVVTTFIIGAVTGNWFVGIGLGTLVTMVGVGRVVAVFQHFCREKILKIAGLD